VDTLGLVWSVCVTAASLSEAEGAKRIFAQARATMHRLKRVWCDAGFENRIEDWTRENCPWTVEIVKRSEGSKGWELLPKRWIVERTLGWLGRCRGLAREYDYLPETTAAKIHLAMTRLMLRRLTA